MSRNFSALPLVLSLAACGGSAPDAGPAPSTLVSVVTPRQGSLPSTVEAYGSVAPAINGAQTLSQTQPGQVTALMVAAGSAVRAGQPLATFVTAPTARSTYQQAVGALTASRKQQASTAQLLSQQLATRDQMAQADKAVSDAKDALAALQAEGAGAPFHTLVAPFSGVVTTIAVAQGDRTQPGAPILTVARAGGIVVTAGVDPSVRAGVAVGQSAHMKRLSGGRDLAGRVIRVDSALNPLTRLVDVDVSFSAGMLLPGEAMQVSIETGQTKGWVVPHAAVVTTGVAPHVFQIVGGKAKAKTVRILLSSDRGDVVDGAIDPASPLIVDGAYQLSDGDAVRRSN